MNRHLSAHYDVEGNRYDLTLLYGRVCPICSSAKSRDAFLCPECSEVNSKCDCGKSKSIRSVKCHSCHTRAKCLSCDTLIWRSTARTGLCQACFLVSLHEQNRRRGRAAKSTYALAPLRRHVKKLAFTESRNEPVFKEPTSIPNVKWMISQGQHPRPQRLGRNLYVVFDKFKAVVLERPDKRLEVVEVYAV